jgi:hypothetical protein
MSRSDPLRLAYQFAEANSIPHHLEKKHRVPGNKLYSFHKAISDEILETTGGHIEPLETESLPNNT